MRYSQTYDGDWTEYPPGTKHSVRCCDCRLVHSLWTRLRKGKIEIRVDRDHRATSAGRRGTPAELIHKYIKRTE